MMEDPLLLAAIYIIGVFVTRLVLDRINQHEEEQGLDNWGTPTGSPEDRAWASALWPGVVLLGLTIFAFAAIVAIPFAIGHGAGRILSWLGLSHG